MKDSFLVFHNSGLSKTISFHLKASCFFISSLRRAANDPSLVFQRLFACLFASCAEQKSLQMHRVCIKEFQSRVLLLYDQFPENSTQQACKPPPIYMPFMPQWRWTAILLGIHCRRFMYAVRNLLLAHLAYLICAAGEALTGDTSETNCIISFFSIN